jgi:hypothetical protein
VLLVLQREPAQATTQQVLAMVQPGCGAAFVAATTTIASACRATVEPLHLLDCCIRRLQQLLCCGYGSLVCVVEVVGAMMGQREELWRDS